MHDNAFRQTRSVSQTTESTHEEAISDLDSLSEELDAERKITRSQSANPIKHPLDEVLDYIDEEEKRLSDARAEHKSTLDNVDELLEELTNVRKVHVTERVNTKIMMSLNEIVTAPLAKTAEENSPIVNDIVQEIKKENVDLVEELKEQFNQVKEVLAKKHEVALQSKNLNAIEDLQARYALFNQWIEALSSDPRYESMSDPSVQEKLAELQKALELAKSPPVVEEQKDLDQWLKELVEGGAEEPSPGGGRVQASNDAVDELDALLAETKPDKEMSPLIDKGKALIEEWDALNTAESSEKDKRNFVKRYEGYLRELDNAGKPELKQTIAFHAAKMIEIRAVLPAMKLNLRHADETTASQGNVSDLAAKKGQEMLERQAHKTACLDALEKIKDVAYKILLTDAISASQQKGKLTLPSIEVINAFVEKANIALNSQTGLNADKHHALLDESNNADINNLFANIKINAGTVYKSSTQAAKDAKTYEVRPSGTTVTSLGFSQADLLKAARNLKPTKR